MIDSEEINSAIEDVTKNYAERYWIAEIKRRIPEASEEFIVSFIEIYFGGDVKAVDDA